MHHPVYKETVFTMFTPSHDLMVALYDSHFNVLHPRAPWLICFSACHCLQGWGSNCQASHCKIASAS